MDTRPQQVSCHCTLDTNYFNSYIRFVLLQEMEGPEKPDCYISTEINVNKILDDNKHIVYLHDMDRVILRDITLCTVFWRWNWWWGLQVNPSNVACIRKDGTVVAKTDECQVWYIALISHEAPGLNELFKPPTAQSNISAMDTLLLVLAIDFKLPEITYSSGQ